LVKAFGDEVESGEHLHLGPYLADEASKKIKEADALIGVASRDQKVNGYYTTFPWVRDELVIAKDNKKLFVQLRETELDPREGFLAGAQYIEYDQANLAGCLVKLAEVLGQWHSLADVSLVLLPEAFAKAVAPLLDSDGFYCEFTLYDRLLRKASTGSATIVLVQPGGLRILLRSVPRDHFIQLEAGHGKKKWKSEVVPIDTPMVIMK
jgi:hypothetical protein